jgi:hypothetical protein
MSGHIGGQARALPFTGFTALPLAFIGLALSSVGWLIAKLRPRRRTQS